MARHRKGRHGPSHRTVVLVGGALGVVLGCGLVAAAAVPLPKGPPALLLDVAGTPAGDGPPPALAFPAQGESAVGIATLHFTEAHHPQTPVPIASLTKLMTAYVALKALPLTPEEQGPSVFVTSDDVHQYRAELRAGDSCVKVADGEVLTERQLLDGLLVHSADNYATLLARLVAGGDLPMVDAMNADAQQLGLTETHYADVSGLDPSSTSTALDVLHLATLLMKNPTFAQIVRQTSVVLPVAGQVTTFQPYLGQPGVIGIKTGSTLEALGCDAMAFDAKAAGKTVQIIAVVLGQSSSHRGLTQAAGRSALVLASSAAHHLVTWRVTTAHAPVGVLGWPSGGVPVAATATVEVPIVSSTRAVTTVQTLGWPHNQVDAGTVVAEVTVTSGSYREVSRAVTTATLTRPSLWQRLR